ncbi:hypothetical protein VOLCADRAFT_90680 [Volvox carteri f. nagariensis]|uniref:Jacalin-type lectin domain-containing protein n=1 Tax=Volvox carteri f. nagariensis TaxID=3068 RepID=D8TVF6_VOLCA|nr:uncharacterized protein VOLCADRAFT_90680 [Volvox carteri f. nagariensis]EFJ48451.1 hypothetical protein VOLCADRAFT_90680 [Volvox carteri f. nagariensis]|eukprot:XP_002950250.1 hypothetical protein VOLCADRAFT_90680 [Volvox carteri f. nagariensis]
MSSLDSKLDLSLDELIKQAAKRPAARALPSKPTVGGSRGLAPKQVGARAPVTTASGIAGKRQAIRTKRQTVPATEGVPGVQRLAPKVLLVKASDLKRKAAAPVPGARALAKRIVNRAVMAPKQPAAAVMRQRGTTQRPQAIVAPARPRQQPQLQQQAPARQPRQQIKYVQQPVMQQQQQQRQVPVSLAKRMRQQRQQQMVVQPRAHAVVPRGQPLQQLAPQGLPRRGPQQQQVGRNQIPRIVPAPRLQQQRQMLGRVQQGGIRKNGQMHQPPQRRAPVFAANGGGRSGNAQRGQQQRMAGLPRQLQRSGGRNQQVLGGNTRNRAPILMQQNAAVGTLPPIQLSQSLRVLKMLPSEVQVHLPDAVGLVARIRALGIAAECRERQGGQGPPDWPRILIAANLMDCEEIMPFWILEVLRLALLLQGDPVLQAIYSPSSGTLQLDLNAKHVQRVGISVYESGSRDRTALWLLVAAALWKAAGVPNAVVLNGTLTRGAAVMEPVGGKLMKQHRIQHLANLRNAALSPLYRNPGAFPYVMFLNDVFFCAPDLVWIGGHVPKVRDSRTQQEGKALRRALLFHTPPSTSAPPSTTTAAAEPEGNTPSAAQHSASSSTHLPTQLSSIASAVVETVLADIRGELKQEHFPATGIPGKGRGRGRVEGLVSDHSAGGGKSKSESKPDPESDLQQQEDDDYEGEGVGDGEEDEEGEFDVDGGGGGGSDPAAQWQAALDQMTGVHAEEVAQRVEVRKRISAAAVKPRYEFYDIWVSRDLGGKAEHLAVPQRERPPKHSPPFLVGGEFIKHDPLARDPRTLDAVHRGLPFPVKCCWNGAVYFNASHLSAGLRFRAGQRDAGECDASECSIFCEDYRRLGSGRVVVDPSVRLSYTPWTEDIHGPLPGGLPAKVLWSAVKRSGALEKLQSLWQETADDMMVECRYPFRRLVHAAADMVPWGFYPRTEKGFDGADLDRVRQIDIRRENFTQLFFERQRQLSPPQSRACNLIMGPYGADDEGEFFDDLSYASWGKNVITRIVHKAGEYVESIQVVYGSMPARVHGGDSDGELHDHRVEGGEFINSAVVYYDENAVHGMDLGTNVGRQIVIGSLRDGVRRAVATPCPADEQHEGRYRLIALAGTADRYLRSVTLLWS